MKKILSILLVAATLAASAQVTTNTGGGSTGGGGGSYTSSNGITLSGSDFKLGGLQTENTSIGGGNYDLSFNNKVFNSTSRRFNLYSDTISFTLSGFRFLHTTSLPGGGHLANNNLFIGWKAGNSTLATDSSIAITAIGTEALYSLQSPTNAAGSSNTALGYKTARNMRYGVRNVVLGAVAMGDCAVGTLGAPLTGNIAIGHHAYRQGASNYAIAIGASAMEHANDNFTDIIGIGQYAMMEDSASFNIGIGFCAGMNTKGGGKNVFLGWNSGASGISSEKNFYGGYYSGFNILGVGDNVAIGAGAMQGGSGATANTTVAIGNNAFSAATSGSRNIFIGNNAGSNGIVNATTGNDNIVIGNTASISAPGANNELNIGNALFGQNFGGTSTVFKIPTLRFGARSTTANSVLDMGLSTLPIILPKSSSRPSVGLETAMMYYNTTSDIVEVNSGTGGSVPIVKEHPISSATSATGFNMTTYSTHQDKVVMILDATSNAITQTIPSASSSYTNTKIEFLITNDGVNAVSFSVPVGTVYNSIVGSTSFTAVDVVTCYCDGSKWIITNK